MSRITVPRTIDASLDMVYKTISNISIYSKAVSNIKKFEFISDIQSGVGTRFRETRLMKGREVTTELEVTEYIENDHIRMVADSHGTVWDSVFFVKSVEGYTELKLTMDAKAYKLLPKLMNTIMKGLIKKGVEKDMDAVKVYCEK
jgi:hypothetical protein